MQSCITLTKRSGQQKCHLLTSLLAFIDHIAYHLQVDIMSAMLMDHLTTFCMMGMGRFSYQSHVKFSFQYCFQLCMLMVPTSERHVNTC